VRSHGAFCPTSFPLFHGQWFEVTCASMMRSFLDGRRWPSLRHGRGHPRLHFGAFTHFNRRSRERARLGGLAATADLKPITIGRPVVGALRTHPGSSHVDALKTLFAAKTSLLSLEPV
jgi:hypothetical protein